MKNNHASKTNYHLIEENRRQEVLMIFPWNHHSITLYRCSGATRKVTKKWYGNLWTRIVNWISGCLRNRRSAVRYFYTQSRRCFVDWKKSFCAWRLDLIRNSTTKLVCVNYQMKTKLQAINKTKRKYQCEWFPFRTMKV